MIDTDTPLPAEAGNRAEDRLGQRRRFLQLAGTATVAFGLSACGGSDGGSASPTPTPSSTPTPSPTSTSTVALDVDYLNFALQLQYLSAQYFALGTTGSGIAASLLTGKGTQGTVTGGAQITFSDAIFGQYAREIAANELALVGLLRSAVGSAAVAAQPAIDLSSAVSGGFTRLARAGGYIGPADTFDAFASEQNFLLGAFILQDVMVSAYIGMVPSLTTLIYINAAADILATKSHNAALIRQLLYARGTASRTATDQLSNARDALDGASDIDQGVTGNATVANVVPSNVDGIVFGRSPGQVLNVLYTNHAAVTGGGFYPNGVTSTYFKVSGAN